MQELPGAGRELFTASPLTISARGHTLMRVFVSVLGSALLLAASPLVAQEPTRHDHAPGSHAGERLGTVRFPNSGSAAQRPFLRGLALLHSFEYDDARTSFRAA